MREADTGLERYACGTGQSGLGKVVLFDMDGVILDSMSYHVRAWQEALEEWGLTVPAEVLYFHEGAIEPETAVAIFLDQGCEMDEMAFKRILERQKAIFTRRYLPLVRPYPEVPELLARLDEAGWTLALVTSSHHEIMELVLPIGIRQRLSCIVTGDRVRRRKPFPDPYLAALSFLQRDTLPRMDCLVVENAPAGIRAAKAAELVCVALTTTLSPQHLQDADLVLPSHRELLDYLAP